MPNNFHCFQTTHPHVQLSHPCLCLALTHLALSSPLEATYSYSQLSHLHKTGPLQLSGPQRSNKESWIHTANKVDGCWPASFYNQMAVFWGCWVHKPLRYTLLGLAFSMTSSRGPIQFLSCRWPPRLLGPSILLNLWLLLFVLRSRRLPQPDRQHRNIRWW